MKVLVCGGRDYADRERVFTTLDDVHAWTVQDAETALGLAFGCAWEQSPRITCIITGACCDKRAKRRGADWLAEEAVWAEIPYRGYPAKWSLLGRRGGAQRNGHMLHVEHTAMVQRGSAGLGMCVAFPGGNGTADMERRCREAGIPVLEVT